MKSFFAALALGAALATPAAAVTVVGTTSGGPTFNRPVAGTPPTGLSGVGTAVSYQVTPFTVATSGSYTFLMTALTPFDTYLGLYSTAFNPASPLTNAITYNDDLVAGNFTTSGFTTSLTAGVSYFALATGFGNADAGRYSLDINGPGAVTVGGGGQGAVPEPTTWAMIIAGFGIVGGALRRRRRADVAFA
jgi:PEP-CTERM motif